MSAGSVVPGIDQCEFEGQSGMPLGTFVRSILVDVRDDGTLVVETAAGTTLDCDCVESLLQLTPPLRTGDMVLAAIVAGQADGVVLGRIGKYRPPEPAKPEPHVVVEATETLTLKCGEASVDLRKDGKVMVRGEDVLLRAKKTQRIKAGTVAIN